MKSIIKDNKKLITINIICILMITFTTIVFHMQTNSLTSEKAASRWAAEDKEIYAQVSCYIPDNLKITSDYIDITRATIIKGFAENSVEVKEQELAFRWIDAYSAYSQLEISTSRANYRSDVYGVGGNFFYFHNYELLCGNYFSEDNLMQDLVVLDESLAWELFGSSDIVGQKLTINGCYFVISGVIKREAGYATKKTYGGSTKLYIPYASMKKVVGSDVYVSCYEAVMPEPIEHFAYNLLVKKLGIDKEKVDYLDNSQRFKEITLLKNVKNYWEMVTKSKAVKYPFWENAAIVVGNIVTVVMFLKYFIILLLLVADIRKITTTWTISAKDIWNYVSDKIYRLMVYMHSSKKRY